MIVLQYITLEISNPSAGWGFMGLLVPVIIHLLSKKERNVIPFGSLRFLEEMESDAARSISLSEYALLFMRTLLLGLLCFLLLGPYINEENETISYWVEEGVHSSEDYDEIINAIPDDSEIRIFRYQIEDSTEINSFESAWTLIEHLNTLSDSSIVFTHSYLKDFKGSPVVLGRNIDWHIVPVKSKEGIKSLFEKEDKTTEWWIETDPSKLEVKSKSISNNISYTPVDLKLELRSNGYTENATLLKNLIDLSEASLPYDIEWIGTSNESQSKNDDDIWQVSVGSESQLLSSNSITWIPSDKELEIKFVSESQLIIRGSISRESILDSNLPVAIASCFNKSITAIHASDERVFDPTTFYNVDIVESYSEVRTTRGLISPIKKPLNTYIFLLMMPVFVIERFLKHRNTQDS